MTHRERVRRTFRFQPTDRVAYDLMEGSVWPDLQEHFRAEHGLTDPEAVLDFLDTDFRWAGMVNERLAAPRRTEQQNPPDPAAELLHSKSIARGPLADAQSIAEIEQHDWPDPGEWQPGDYAQERRRWPDHALVFAPGWWPLFWGSCEAFGVEPALTNMIAEPALFECAVRCIHERYLVRLARGLAAARGHFDICWLGDDFASQESMFLSPEHWRRFIKPCLAEQVALARRHDLYVLYHSCGAVRPVLNDLIEIGVNGLLVFQTSARGMDAASIARDFGGRLTFYGGMDVQQLLSFGTADEVVATVRANVQAFAKCGGYVVANSHHRVPTINGGNIETMCRAARDSCRTGE
ncbi:hypothetical protein HQ590_15990 [bacterium]|nr:hypothetical protein [bacterium]